MELKMFTRLMLFKKLVCITVLIVGSGIGMSRAEARMKDLALLNPVSVSQMGFEVAADSFSQQVKKGRNQQQYIATRRVSRKRNHPHAGEAKSIRGRSRNPVSPTKRGRR
jgi:hypothetical protein